MKNKNLTHQRARGAWLILGFIGVVIGLAVVIFALYRFSTGQSVVPSFFATTDAEFSDEVRLGLEQTAKFGSAEDSVTFRFTKLEPAKNPNAQCQELCLERLPSVMTELGYSGETYRGLLTSETGTLDMSYEENGAYPLVPFSIELVGVDFAQRTGTIKVTRKEFQKVEFGKQFSIGDDGVAVLKPGDTGVHIRFGVCGSNLPCVREVDFYVDDEYVSLPYGFAEPKGSSESQVMPKSQQNYIEASGVRLRFIESDHKTYAKFVMEKM